MQLSITAQEAAQRASQFAHGANDYRPADDPLPEIQELSEQLSVFIFNVSPWPFSVGLGSLGNFYIPACEDGQTHSRGLKIPGIVQEQYPEGDNQMKLLKAESGRNIAQQILGIGPHLHPRNSLTLRGVFSSNSPEPTAKELAEANKALNIYYRQLVATADSAFSAGPKALEDVLSNGDGRHYLAARKIGRTAAESPWLGNATQEINRKECPNCGAAYKPGIAECPKCGDILDMEKYKAKLARQDEARRAVRETAKK